MFKNMLISTKLKVNAAIVVIGLAILALISFTSINSLEKDYNTYNTMSEQLESYKALLIGGLMVNSASVTYAFDPASLKPIDAATNGLEKATKFSKKIEKLNTVVFESFKEVAKKTLVDAKVNEYITPEEVQKLLKVWRPLKLDVINNIKILKKKQQKLSKIFYGSLSSLFFKIFVVISIITLFVLLISMLISKGIIKSLTIFENSMKSLADGKDSKKIELENQDETTKIAQYFNQYMDNVRDGIEQDKKVISETKILLKRLMQGF